MKRIITWSVLVLLLLSAGCKKAPDIQEIFPRVLEAPVYTQLDYDYARKYFAEHYDNWGGGCTAVAKQLEDGTVMLGRNMDLTISHKPAYVIRTRVKDCYETVGLSYTFRGVSPDWEQVMENGLTEEYRKLLPFFADDVLNSQGLYVEVNMRNGETDPTGKAKFSCKGTNPDSDQRVYLFTLPRYIGEHCATVDEALEYVKTLDIYSMDGYWTYCFMMGDATGRYGLLEFAKDQIIWHEGQQAQANFYVDEQLAAEEDLKCGVGRYDTVMAGIDAVANREDMFRLMDRVSYSRAYHPDTCPYDYRSEFVGILPSWTYDHVMAEENRPDVEAVAKTIGDTLDSMSREQIEDVQLCWESTFTEVINCNEKTIYVRFFEDPGRICTLCVDSGDTVPAAGA